MIPFRFDRRAFLGAGLAMFIAGDAFSADSGDELATKVFKIIDGLDVEHKWPAGTRVDWQTGLPNGKPVTGDGKNTHCSSFVAVAAMALGIYILRPPEHGPKLLANAQYDWLSTEGAAQGWVELKDMSEAQDKASQGFFVVASYCNHNPAKPGHIAIIRPGNKDAATLAAEGPDETQAGFNNYRSTSLVNGFAGHRRAWTRHEIRYFAHAVDETKFGV